MKFEVFKLANFTKRLDLKYTWIVCFFFSATIDLTFVISVFLFACNPSEIVFKFEDVTLGVNITSFWVSWEAFSNTHLSSLDIMISCVWFADVLAEKLMAFGMYLKFKYKWIKMSILIANYYSFPWNNSTTYLHWNTISYFFPDTELTFP